MLKESLRLYFKNNFDLFFPMYDLASKAGDVDAVHDLRVSLKRIDTMLRMLNYGRKANFRLRKSFRPLKRLFKKAGLLRDFQVQEALLADIAVSQKIDKCIVERFTQRKNGYQSDFLKQCRSFNKIRIRRFNKLIDNYIHENKDEDLQIQLDSFFRSRFLQLNSLTSPVNGQYLLHDARKVIKDLAYLIEMSVIEPENNHPQFIDYKQFGHILGNWHDSDVMLQYLSEIQKRKINSDAKNLGSLIWLVAERKVALQEEFLKHYIEFKNK